MTSVLPTEQQTEEIRAPRLEPTFVAEPPVDVRRRLISTGIALLIAELGAATLGDHPLFQIIAIATLMWIPGRLVMRCAGYVPAGPAASTVVTVGLSITSLTLVGLTVNTVGRLLSLPHPLTRTPLLMSMCVFLTALALAGARRPGPPLVAWPAWRHIGVAAGCLVPPMLAICGALRLNNDQPKTVAVLGVLAAGLMLTAGFLFARRWSETTSTAVLAAATTALALAFSLRGSYLYGFDIQQEFGTFLGTQAAGQWSVGHTGLPDDAYRAMLSITILPQVLVQLSGVSALDVFRLVFPLLIAGIPVSVLALVRQRASPRIAFAVAIVLLLLPQTTNQLPGTSRQVVALLIFGALLVVLFDVTARRGRSLVSVLLVTGLVVSHYSTTYVAIFILIGCWVGTTLLRSRRRGRPRYRRAVSAGTALWLLIFGISWNLLITNSVSNLRQFATGTAHSGFNVLPANKPNAGLLDRWLKSPVPGVISGPEFSDAAGAQYRKQYPWMDHYPKSEVDKTPLETDRVPDAQGAVNLAPVLGTGTAVANQALLLSVVAGVGLFAWSRRKNRDTETEVSMIMLSALLLTGFGRVNGSALESYNADRLYLQTLIVFGLGLAFLATAIARAAPWVRRSAQGLTAGLAAVLFLGTTQVAASAIGGNLSPNVSNEGDSAERYLYTPTDVEMAIWLDKQAPKGALVFVDRYMVLAMWNTTSGNSRVYASLAPSSVDPRGYVLFDNVNISRGRARGLVGRSMGVFRTPTKFMQDHKNLIYSTANSRIYK